MLSPTKEQTIKVFQILSIWFVIIASVFPFGSYHANEFNKLPLAKKAVEADWLTQDWYLNLKSEYYDTFNQLLGPLISWFGFETGATIGRLVAYFMFAVSLYILCRSLRIHFALVLVIIYLFLNFENQSLVAGEWILGGVESKTVAYAFSLVALTAFLQQRYLLGFACAGAALSTHVLTGLYAIFCIVVACIFTLRDNELRKTVLSKSWIFFLTGLGGLPAITHQLLTRSTVDSIRAGILYVTYRNPHHLLPSVWWQGRSWKVGLILSIILFVWVYSRSHSQKLRFVAAYSLGSVLLFLIGLGIWKLGYIHLLKYYWFRFPDTIVPLLTLILLGAIFSHPDWVNLPFLAGVQAGWGRWNGQIKRYRVAVLATLTVLVLLLTAKQFFSRAYYVDPSVAEFRLREQPMLTWIAQNTPQDAVFLVDPALQGFYVYAKRAMIVSFKHAPHTDADFLEWYERIKQVNGGRAPEKSGLESFKELSENFYQLNVDSIKQIAKTYKADYYLGKVGKELQFDCVHRKSDFILYKLPK